MLVQCMSPLKLLVVQMFMDVSDDEGGRRRRTRRQAASPAVEADEGAEEDAVEHSGGANNTLAPPARPEPHYSWLQDCCPNLAFFVPQVHIIGSPSCMSLCIAVSVPTVNFL
jgi:hypothetical protein